MTNEVRSLLADYLSPIRDPKPFSGKDYVKNRGRRGNDAPCVLCGRRCNNPKLYMRVIDGGSAFGDPSLPPDSVPGDMYSFPIGSCCLRKHKALVPYSKSLP